MFRASVDQTDLPDVQEITYLPEHPSGACSEEDNNVVYIYRQKTTKR